MTLTPATEEWDFRQVGKVRFHTNKLKNFWHVFVAKSGETPVLTELLIDTYDLYGRVAMPKHNQQDLDPEIYQLAAASGGVFVNPALTEPFGLTLLEAAASGLPLVATKNGGPVDIIGSCGNRILVDPLDKSAIAEALLQLLTNTEDYRQMRDNGLRKVRTFNWLRSSSESCRKRPKSLLRRQVVSANLTLAFGRYLDVIRSRAGKGQALRYVDPRWGIPLK